MNVRGTLGTLKEYNDAHGGPMAYLGSTVPGFPNFFMMEGMSQLVYLNESLPTLLQRVPLDTGPNTVTGHTSVLFSEETQVPYLLQLLEPVRAGILKSVAPTDAATDRYNDMLQERLNDTVWSQCVSWYRVGGRGRIASTFPGPLVLFWWWLWRLRWEDYEIDGPGVKEWRRRHARRSSKARFVMLALAGVFVALVSAVLLGGVELKEVPEQAVRFSGPIFVNVVCAEPEAYQFDVGKCCQTRLESATRVFSHMSGSIVAMATNAPNHLDKLPNRSSFLLFLLHFIVLFSISQFSWRQSSNGDYARWSTALEKLKNEHPR